MTIADRGLFVMPHRGHPRSAVPAGRLDADPSPDVALADEPDASSAFDSPAVDFEEASADAGVQFRRVSEAERRSRRNEPIECILDGDAEEKLDGLVALLAGVKRGGVIASAADLLREARWRFHDGSDLQLALRELRRRRLDAGADVAFVDEAIETCLADGNPTHIKAGINAALKARIFGAQLQLDPRQLRDLYRQFLEFEGACVFVYEDWIERFGAPRRRRILDYVRAALGYDMRSLDPSYGDPRAFGPRLKTLNMTRMLTSADTAFVAIVTQAPGASSPGIDEASALSLMLGGLQQPYALPQTLSHTVGVWLDTLTPERRSQWLQRVRRAFAGIPAELYGDDEARSALIESLETLIGSSYVVERRQMAATYGGGLT
ncbi:type III secretion system gatekeeper subunit SctW [Burkholderia dolosa]|uniref:type III secretion system gatekeeper subunit SctW n=1 Tax=Burkholderia dolosa TaxID=152500 RepID=UPI001591ECD2|nr:type III secretion system gatekeeper subunit SctW [Burkholderia dolosa]MBR8458391.1 type III secretion system gatekeeper subunit SctW [Burkholderia dolosa]